MAAIKKTNEKLIVARIISEFKDRNRAEIKKWRQALDLAKNPDTPRSYTLQDLYDNLESDGHLISQVGLRKAATLSNDFSIIDKKTGKKDEVKTELFKSEWFFNIVDNALDSVMKGYTLLELSDPETMKFELIPRRNVVPTKSMVLFEVGGDKGIDYSVGFENSLLIIEKPTNLGLMSDLCGQLIWKRNAQQSWAEFTEKYGNPLITATTNKRDPKDIAKVDSMLKSLGEAAQAVLPEGTTIDIKPYAGSDSYKVFDMQIARINTELTKPVTGGTMISDSGSSRSQSEVHERNLDDKIAPKDKRMIEFLVNGQLLRIMNFYGWDVNPETDRFQYDADFKLTLGEHWTIVSGALDKGFNIPIDWISKRFNMPIDGIVQKIQPTPPAGKTLPAKASFSENFR